MEYSALPDQPEASDSGPRLHGPAAPVLGLLLRLANAALSLLGLLLLGWSLYLEWEWGHSSGPGPTPSPSPEPSPPPELSPSPSPGPDAWAQPLVVRVASSAALRAAVASYPWFIYAVGAAGAYLLATGLVGASGVKRGSRWWLGVYIALLSLALLAEAAGLLLVFTDNTWRERIPGDPSGCWEAALQYLEANSQLAKLVALAVMAVQLVALTAASWLHSLYQAAYEAWLDEREEEEARARRMLGQAVQRQYEGGGSSLWMQRMRQKYGVDDRQVQCNSEAVRRVAALSNDLPAGGSP